MSVVHKHLAAGRWQEMSLVEQLANVGSEVERAIKWKNKGNKEISQRAFLRGIELLDLSKRCNRDEVKLKELCRLKEVLVDFFIGDNTYGSTDELWRRYFYAFNYRARNCSSQV